MNWKYSLTLVALNRFADAEVHAKKAWGRFETWKHFSAEKKIEYIEGLVVLYDAWHKAEPDAGHDRSATRWRAKLEEAAAAAT